MMIGGLLALSASCAVPLEQRTAGELRRLMGDSRAAGRQGLADVPWKALGKLYRDRGFQPLWTREGRPSRQAESALQVLRAATDDGLDPSEFSIGWLDPAARRLRRGPVSSARRIAEFDTRLSAALARYAIALGRGQVPAAALGWDLRERGELDVAEIVGSMSQAPDPTLEVRRIQPGHPQYRALRRMLLRYRELLADPGVTTPHFTHLLRTNQRSRQVPALRRLLVALGDHPAAGAHPRDSLRFDGRLVRALRHFQRRHSIPTQGRMDTLTLAELNVPLASRVRQLELSMEHWRSHYRLGPAPYVVVNLAAFSLELVGGSGADRERFRQRVVVGKATDSTMTPVLASRMGRVVIWPYWNVPTSIVRNELLPEFLKDSTYLERNHYEIVRFKALDSLPLPATLENLDKVMARGLLLRQRPGPWNPLGPAKLQFGNRYDVYLHGSPAREYFSRRRRDVSHGCVRVDDIIELVQRLLREQPEQVTNRRDPKEWDPKIVEQALKDSVETRIDLPRTIPIYFIYATAAVSDQGELSFYRDLYGLDARLDSLLRAAPGGSPGPS